MQKTRSNILEVLREKKKATVEEIVDGLFIYQGEITAVTVRHHLAKLESDKLINPPEIIHGSSPGRPKYTYSLSAKGESRFPNNYQQFADCLMNEITNRYSNKEVNVILEGVAQQISDSASLDQNLTLINRMDKVITYMNKLGYEATYEKSNGGYILHTTNCPYHAVAMKNEELCQMDMKIVSNLLRVVPRLLSRISDGDSSCSYFIPEK